ncbi:kinase-like domain-containing protein [Lipomyces japonicus]|uniref:kinase-like domain-containing protein n=1 Tax=Lipomyces japonicus TaxID=56871 RepID=UPI0034CE1C41
MPLPPPPLSAAHNCGHASATPAPAAKRASEFQRPRRVSSIVQTLSSIQAATIHAQDPVGLSARASSGIGPSIVHDFARGSQPGPAAAATISPIPTNSISIQGTELDSHSKTTSIDGPNLAAKTLRRKNFKQLSLPTLSSSLTKPSQSTNVVSASMTAPLPHISSSSNNLPLASLQDAQVPGGSAERYYHNNLVESLSTLEIGVEFRLDLRIEDLKTVLELGAGNGGTVSKVMHLPTRTLMAKKMIHIEAKPAVRKQIVRELHIMHECHSKYIVSFYGAFVNEGDVVMCMEYMDCGSLDRIMERTGPLNEAILGKITESVVEGLTYLYNLNRIIHRDVKPSNVLVNSHGQIKLCDFGVSGELINSIADTFVGTSTYMSPERIQGAAYSVKSDVWSLGLMLLELAIGNFPFDRSGSATSFSILDLLQQIVNEPAPTLPETENFSKELRDCIDRCLIKDVDARPTPQDLLTDPFVLTSKRRLVDTETWAKSTLHREHGH